MTADAPIRATLHVLRIPLIRPFRGHRGAIDHRDVALVELHGPESGWGEAAPYPGQDESIGDLIAAARDRRTTPTLAAAVDEAATDLVARSEGRPLQTDPTPPGCRAVGIDDSLASVGSLVDAGVEYVKIKVAPGATRLVAEVRSAFPDIGIGVDGNGSFPPENLDEALALADHDLVFAEELFVGWGASAARFTESTGVPLFADESVRSLGDVDSVIVSTSVGGAVLKPGRLGWSGCALAASRLAAAGKLFRASGLLETSVGRAYTNALAADRRAFLSDVAPARSFLDGDVTDGEEHGGAGIGFTPDPELIARYRTGVIEAAFELS